MSGVKPDSDGELKNTTYKCLGLNYTDFELLIMVWPDFHAVVFSAKGYLTSERFLL